MANKKNHYFEAVPVLKDSGFTQITAPEFVDNIDSLPENPKEIRGREKCPMHLLPPEFLTQVSNVLGSGATKYGPWNWRSSPIKMSTYLGAMLRHLTAVADGEDIDESGFPHVAHIAASCAILLDAGKHGSLVDDRPKNRTRPA